MQNDFRAGTVLAVIGSMIGLVAFYLFVMSYNYMIAVELNAGRPDEAVVVRLVFPILGYCAIAAGVLWMLSLYGFVLRARWAWMLGVIASTVHLLCGFFPMIPAMSRREPPVMMAVFGPSLLLWIALLVVRRINWQVGVLAFAAGLAYVLSFMDGVATIDKIQLSETAPALNGMYVMVQQINWWATIAWAVFIFALLGRKAWAPIVGLGAGLMAMLGGYPLAVASTLEEHRFSMFAPSPLLSTALVLFLLLPFARHLLSDWAEAKPSVETKVPGTAPAPTAIPLH